MDQQEIEQLKAMIAADPTKAAKLRKIQADVQNPNKPEYTDWHGAKDAEELATGRSQAFTDLKNIPMGAGAGEGMSFVGGSRPKGPPPRQPTPEEQMTRQQYEEQMRSQGGGPAVNINMQKPTGLITGDVPHHDQPYVPPKEDYSILPRIVPERPTFGSTMKYMGGGLMDAGRSIGGGLSSMGKSLGAGTKSLFDDPQRMALLQGGLSMMDPNTYYDKQGFGSVFTGLNKGLGAAQQGHAGVLARRKAVSDRALVDANARVAEAGGTDRPSSYVQLVNNWRLAKANGDKKLAAIWKDRIDVLRQTGAGSYNTKYQGAVGKTKGEAVGTESVGLQTAEDAYAYTSDLITRMIDHPGMSGVIGWPSVYGLTHMPGTHEADFRALQEQVKGEAFLQAFQSLKGGGHITDIEGEKAEKARVRMDTAQTEAGFKAAMKEYLAVLDKGIARARRQAKGDLTGRPSKFEPRGKTDSEYNPLGLSEDMLSK